ncbi:TPA: hypothetical protein I8005_001634 [Legionella pneumophila]|nr:hypothetical protein [Legionella pneumophila]
MRDDSNQLNQQYLIHEKELNFKLNLFMVALIFGVLSISIQFPISSNSRILLKLMESISWFTLVLSGYFALVNVGKFPVKMISGPAEYINKIFKRKWSDELLMWRLLYLAIFLLIVVKTVDKF